MNTAMQFEQIGEQLLASEENVSTLTNSMTDIRAELARMFGLLAQDIAVQNASHASQPLHTPDTVHTSMIANPRTNIIFQLTKFRKQYIRTY